VIGITKPQVAFGHSKPLRKIHNADSTASRIIVCVALDIAVDSDSHWGHYAQRAQGSLLVAHGELMRPRSRCAAIGLTSIEQ